MKLANIRLKQSEFTFSDMENQAPLQAEGLNVFMFRP